MSDLPSLLEQKERIDTSIAQIALGTPCVEGLSFEEFNHLLKGLENLVEWEDRYDVVEKWRNAFVEQQKQSPEYIRSLIELKCTNNETQKEDVTAYRHKILHLLNAKEESIAKEVWYENVARLHIDWRFEEVKQLPRPLVKEYVKYLATSSVAHLSQSSQEIIEKVHAAIDDRKLSQELEKLIGECNFNDYDIVDYDDSSEMAKECKYNITVTEKLLASIAMIWYPTLQQEERTDVDWIPETIRGIYRHTVQVNRCPPGSNITCLRADANQANDLIAQTEKLYSQMPVSAIMRNGSRTKMAFVYGSPYPRATTISQCTKQDTLSIEFPYLCYVAVSHVEITIHNSSFLDLNNKKADCFTVVTGTSSIPFRKSWFIPEEELNACKENGSNLIKIMVSHCPWQKSCIFTE
jgi:hypothetical protein